MRKTKRSIDENEDREDEEIDDSEANEEEDENGMVEDDDENEENDDVDDNEENDENEENEEKEESMQLDDLDGAVLMVADGSQILIQQGMLQDANDISNQEYVYSALRYSTEEDSDDAGK